MPNAGPTNAEVPGYGESNDMVDDAADLAEHAAEGNEAAERAIRLFKLRASEMPEDEKDPDAPADPNSFQKAAALFQTGGKDLATAGNLIPGTPGTAVSHAGQLIGDYGDGLGWFDSHVLEPILSGLSVPANNDTPDPTVPSGKPSTGDPLVLDLSGMGIDLVSLSGSAAYFDYSNSGFAVHTGWIASGQGILVANPADGQSISSANVLGAQSGNAFTDLAAFDTNGDGVIDSTDAGYASLRVWIDNGDGVSVAGELHSLNDLGIVSISLASTPSDATVGGNQLVSAATFTSVSNGETSNHTIAEVNFSTDSQSTRYSPPAGFAFDMNAANLPDLIGYGKLPELWVSMSLDQGLQDLVRSLVLNSSSMSTTEFDQAFESVLYKWAGADNIDPTSRGPSVDAQHLAVVYAFYGIDQNIDTAYAQNPNAHNGPAVWEPTYRKIVSMFEARFVSQISISQIMNGVGLTDAMANPYSLFDYVIYDRETDRLSFDSDQLTKAVLDSVPSDELLSSAYWERITPVLDQLGLGFVFGSDGNDVQGSAVAPLVEKTAFDLGAGDDVLYANSSSGDVFVYKSGDGNDTLQLQGGSSTTSILLNDLNPIDIELGYAEHDLRIIDTRTGDTISVKDQFSSISGGISHITFANGVRWDADQLLANLDITLPTDGSEYLSGSGSTDFMYGGTGDDVLRGGVGDDIYLWKRGGGHDEIDESAIYGGSDRLALVGVNPEDVALVRSGNDLTIVVTPSADGANDGGSILLANEFYSTYGNGNFDEGVEKVIFADGTVWTAQTMRDMLLTSTAVDENFVGFATDDTYRYSRGGGNDSIDETAIYSGSADKLILTEINPADVTLVRNGDDLTLVIAESAPGAGDGGSILLKSELNGQFDIGVEQISFADGTVWTTSDLRTMLLATASTSGNDTIVGFNTDDVITCGLGDDALTGGGGNDTYVYSRGDGNDTIDESPIYSGQADKLVFTDIDPDDVTLVRSGDAVSLVIADSAPGANDGGSVLLYAEFFSTYGNGNFEEGVEQVVFADGTVWTAQTMRDKLLTSTAADENFVGFATDDTYVYARGGGNDTINETAIYSGSADKLVLVDIDPDDVSFVRNGNDVTLVIAESSLGAGDGGSILLYGEFSFNFDIGVEKISFSDGTVWTPTEILARVLSGSATSGNDTINGTSADDTLAGGRGDDTLSGGTGSDTYVYSRGDGNDTIIETQYYAGNDKLVFTDINQSDVTLVRNGNDVTLVIGESTPGANDGGSVLLASEFYSTYGNGNFDIGVEQVVFADGTTWSSQTMRDMLLTSTSADESFVGFATDDTYRYSRGGGNDSIDETAIYSGSNDKLILTDIDRDDVQFTLNGADITLNVAPSTPGGTDGGSILLKGELSGNYDIGVEQIVFVDGVTITQSQIHDQLLTSTSADETLTGFGTSDTYFYARGGGNDTLVDGVWGGDGDTVDLTDINPSDVTVSGVGNDIVLHVKESSPGAGDAGSVTLQNSLNDGWDIGIEFVKFADGTTWSRNIMRAHILADAATDGNDTINGFNSDDIISGGKGDDILNGGGGWDTYLYSRGDGNDTINEGAWSGSDTLKFTDINLSEVNFTQNGNDLIVNVAESSTGAGDGGSILLVSSVNDGSEVGVERVAFADGTVLNRNQIRTLLLTSTPADENFTGFGGDDTFVYARGGGNDTFSDGMWSGNDTLHFADINPDDVRVGINGNDIVITIAESAPGAGDAGSVTLKDSLNDNNQLGLEYVSFADGTSWSRNAMRAQFLADAATDGDDTINGFNSDDVISGGKGNDILNGGGGWDTYLYSRGDGNDTINEGAWSGSDTLKFTDINLGEVNFTQNGNDLTVHVADSSTGAGDGGSILLTSSVNDGSEVGVEQVAFADGTVLNRNQIRSLLLTSTPADETFTGFGGDDTYHYARGGGNDTLIDGAWSGSNDTVVLDDINPDQVTIVGVGNDVVLHIPESSPGAGDAGSVTLQNSLSDGWDIGIENIRFADGTTWSRNDMRANILADSATSGNDTITGYSSNDVISGLAGDDSLYGGDGDDILTGGAGNDYLEGGNGNDTYKFTFGDGQDIIEDRGSTSDIDTLLLGAGISASDVTITNAVNGDDLLLAINGSSDSVLLRNQLVSSSGGVDQIAFADGTTWDRATISSHAVAA